MSNNILIAGATGLIGSSLIDLILKDNPFDRVIVLSRKELPNIKNYKVIENYIIDFKKLDGYKDLFKANTFINTLGTTIKKAGSQNEFFRVDYQIPKRIAELCLLNGLENIILVSAIGADPNSRIFYNRVKGELERDLIKMKLKSTHILRPSLLMGHREEVRLGEIAGKLFFRPLSVFIPKKYRPVKAKTVAKKIYHLSIKPGVGVHIYEGEDLYNFNPSD